MKSPELSVNLPPKIPSRVSVKEYMEENKVEAPPIHFFGIPCRHAGKESAQIVINELKSISPDLVLFEDITGYVGKDIMKDLETLNDTRDDGDMSNDSFNREIYKFLVDSKVEVAPLNGYFATQNDAFLFQNKMMESFEFRQQLLDSSKIEDDEKAWEFLLEKWEKHISTIKNIQHEREESTLANIAPTILSSKNAKNIHKVALIMGHEHAQGIFNVMKERGDLIDIKHNAFTKHSTGDHSSLSRPSFFLWSIITYLGDNMNAKGRTIYEYENHFGEKNVTFAKVKDVFLKLRHGVLEDKDITINPNESLG